MPGHVAVPPPLAEQAQLLAAELGHPNLTATVAALLRGFVDGTYRPDVPPPRRHPQRDRAVQLVRGGAAMYAAAREVGVAWPTVRGWVRRDAPELLAPAQRGPQS